jgi:ornithine carbamoyltransferase
MRDFLTIADLTSREMHYLVELSIQIKQQWKSGESTAYLQNKVLGMIFQKPSLRTRVSFEVGMLQLGGNALYLSPNEIQLGKRESVADVARVVSRYTDIIMARVFGHYDVVELAKYASVPVINGLSDYTHPCQGMADFLTIFEHKGTFNDIKLVYLGDGNNVATTLLFGAALLGIRFSISTPQGYELSPAAWSLGHKLAEDTGAVLSSTYDPLLAVTGADIIYTDTWTSMGQEAEVETRRKIFPPYQVNEQLLSFAKDDVIVMHCLPAHRGEEITDAVADGKHSVLFDQAENRLHAQKAILVWALDADKGK